MLEHSKQKAKYNFQNNLHPWSIDVWSFGTVLLEMTLGYPIWLPYKGKIVSYELDGEELSSEIMTGLLGVPARDGKKIAKL